mmetsp:Transcript_17829/g.21315  ORF Transcript_17829/g.21315 Transcript_17829/m.21315 type:complete len:634 (+) Transcript_17829:153-2054(+)
MTSTNATNNNNKSKIPTNRKSNDNLHHHHHHHLDQDINNGRRLLSPTQYCHDDDVDMEYCKEISRRAVARAALHLGVEEMSGDALCVLGDVLVSYLERIGKVMSATVEASSRSSAHCNVFDALHAVDACTPAAAYQLHLHKPLVEDDGTSIMRSTAPTNSKINGTSGGLGSPWEGLASFLFGDDWCDNTRSPPSLSLTVNNNNNSIQSNGCGVLPNDGNGINPNSIPTQGTGGGWNVPHYDTIEPYPQRSRRTRQRRIFFHDLGKEEEACRSSGGGASAVGVNGDGGSGTKPGMVNNVTISTKQQCVGAGESKIDGKAAPMTTNTTKANVAAEGAELNASAQANEIPEWNYQNGITSFWGSVVASNALSRRGTAGDGSGGGKDTDASVTSGGGKDGGGGKSNNEDDGAVTGAKRGRDDTSTKVGSGITTTTQGQKINDKRAKTISFEDGKGEGGDTMLQTMRKLGRRPSYVPPFLPPFPPEHTYNPSSSIVLSVSPGARSSTVGITGDVAAGSSGGVAGLSTSSTAMSSTTGGAGGFHQAYNERESKSVRESLVTLGRSVGTTFWGSTMPITRQIPMTRSGSGGGIEQAPSIHVQTSMLGGANQARIKNNLFAPLERASTSKVSRILEGSYNA